jgi:hypothetical protein
MDTGSVVTALVKEYTDERPRNMAIYCLDARISMRGRSYVFEMMDDNDEYIPKAAFTDKDAVSFLICQMVNNVLNNAGIELRNKESGFFDVKNVLGHLESDQEKNKEIILEHLRVLASESSITL